VWVFLLINFIYNQFVENKMDVLGDADSVRMSIKKSYKNKLEEKVRAEQD